MDIKNTKRTDIKIGDWIKVSYNEFNEESMKEESVIKSGIVDFIDRLEFCDDYHIICEDGSGDILTPDYTIIDVKHN